MKGILFRPDMVKAIVEGRKTQTRRLDHLKEINKEPDKWERVENMAEGQYVTFDRENNSALKMVKPRYRVGETVYIEEAIKTDGLWQVQYIDGEHPINPLTNGWYPWQWERKILSPMFMPAWAARHVIRITGVRAERLQKITETDAQNEGVTRPPNYSLTPHYWEWFKYLWDSINKPPYDWQSNPWCWIYSFKKIEKGE